MNRVLSIAALRKLTNFFSPSAQGSESKSGSSKSKEQILNSSTHTPSSSLSGQIHWVDEKQQSSGTNAENLGVKQQFKEEVKSVVKKIQPQPQCTQSFEVSLPQDLVCATLSDKIHIKKRYSLDKENLKINVRYVYVQNNTSLSLKDHTLSLLKIQNLQKQCPVLLAGICYEMVHLKPFNEQQLYETDEYVKNRQKFLEQNRGESIPLNNCVPVLLLKDKIQNADKDNQVCICEEEIMETHQNLSILNIACSLFEDTVVFTYKIPQNDICSFQKLSRTPELLQTFIYQQSDLLEKIFLVNKGSVLIHSIAKGSLIVTASITCQTKQLLQVLLKKEIYFKRLFTKYRISEECFEQQPGFEKFWDEYDNLENILIRGGFPYYPPVQCTRFNLKVKGKYEDDEWIQYKHTCKSQWAIGYHGSKLHQTIKLPENNQEIPRIQKMMEDFETGNMFKIGSRQAHEGFHDYMSSVRSQLVHNPSAISKHWDDKTKVGAGIYFTPYYELAMNSYGFTKNDPKKGAPVQRDSKQIDESLYSQYGTVIACRLNPFKIQISCQSMQLQSAGDDGCHWIMPQSQDIRPYGIIVSTRRGSEEATKYLQRIRKMSVDEANCSCEGIERPFYFKFEEWQEKILLSLISFRRYLTDKRNKSRILNKIQASNQSQIRNQ